MSCQSGPAPEVAVALPTTAAVAQVTPATETPTTEPTVTVVLPPTWTPEGQAIEIATPGEFLTFTPRPTETPWPTITLTPSQTSTPWPTATETTIPTETPNPNATPTFAPPSDGNWLPNPSFEEGWYHPNGDPELQIPDRWRFYFREGENELDSDSWNRWVKPEVRVLSPDFLPPNEHDLFIWDGQQTVKVFKGSGAISFELITDAYLEPGTYLFTIRVYPDLIADYTDGGGKVWADDELAGEVQLVASEFQSPWLLPEFGEQNILSHTFILDEGRWMAVGVAIRGRWALENNGWFIDHWELRRIGGQ